MPLFALVALLYFFRPYGTSWEIKCNRLVSQIFFNTKQARFSVKRCRSFSYGLHNSPRGEGSHWFAVYWSNKNKAKPGLDLKIKSWFQFLLGFFFVSLWLIEAATLQDLQLLKSTYFSCLHPSTKIRRDQRSGTNHNICDILNFNFSDSNARKIQFFLFGFLWLFFCEIVLAFIKIRRGNSSSKIVEAI